MKTLLPPGSPISRLALLLLSVASVLSVRSNAQLITPGPAIRSIQAGSGITITTNGTSRTVTYSGSSGDITGGAVTGGLLTVSEAAGILTYGLTTNAVRSAISGIYLPLSGGTMTGNISIPGMGATATAYGEGFRVENEGDTKESSIGFSGLYVRNGSAYATVENDSTNTVFSSSAGVIVRPGAMAEITLDGDVSVEGALTGSGTNLTGIVKLPTGHTSGVTNLVGIAGDGVTPVFVPTSSTWQGFIAYRSTSNQALPLSATTALIYNAEERDALGLHDTSTGYFRPNKTGLWRITAQGSFSPTSGNPAGAGNYQDLRLRKVSDSSVVAVLSGWRTVSTSFGATLGAPGTAIVALTTGTDYNLAFNNGDTKEWSLFATQTVSRFSAEYLGE